VKKKHLRVVSYNIHRGLSPFSLRDVACHIKALLTSSKADICCLQEDVSEGLFNQSDLVKTCQDVWHHSVFSQTIRVQGSRQGNTIATRFPIAFSEAFKISGSLPGEPRRLLICELDLGGPIPLLVACTHFGLSRGHRMQNLNRLLAVLARYDRTRPMILAGDFNDWPCELSVKLRRELGLYDAYYSLNGSMALTFPVFFPCLALDRIYARGLDAYKAFVVKDRYWHKRSDHLPIVADFDLQAILGRENLR
jgi:endonuclease/exonuclease/phosphatase family metal-dependent hydrolase